ncbi:MAG: chloride channel protein [Nitrospirota bacterium]|nr:chloride channel protein [Nitrospirota bacterium]
MRSTEKKLVICGISAGFASVFGTPIAGALFAAEVLFVGRVFYSVLFPSVIAAVVGFQVASALGVTYLTSPLHPLSQFSPSLFFFVGLSGMAFGFIALVFVEILQVGRRLASQTHLSGPLKGLLGGMVLLGVALAFSDQFLGLGFVTLHQALQGSTVIWYAFLLKILTTSLTLNFGGSGGIVLPLFFVGATSGSLFAEVLGLDLGMFAALGMVSVLAGAVNIPITSIVLAMELFGPSIAPYAAITCVMSFLLTGHRSVIPTQILEETKCSSIQVEKGQEIGQAMPSVQIRNKTLTKLVVSTFLRWRNPKRKTEP